MANVAADRLRLRDTDLGWPLEELWVTGDLLEPGKLAAGRHRSHRRGHGREGEHLHEGGDAALLLTAVLNEDLPAMTLDDLVEKWDLGMGVTTR